MDDQEITSLYNDLKSQKYLDPVYGTVSNCSYGDATSGFNCDNPSLFTAEALLLEESFYWPGMFAFFKRSQVMPGLYHRFPGDNGDTSQDEIMGMSTLDAYTADLILKYGDSHWWVFQPQGGKFVWSSWKGRIIWLRPYVKLQATGKMNIVEQLLWSVCCVISPFSAASNTSGKLLFWTMSTHMSRTRMPWLCGLATRFWKWKMSRVYSGGLQQVMTIYFGSAHPFVKYARKDFG